MVTAEKMAILAQEARDKDLTGILRLIKLNASQGANVAVIMDDIHSPYYMSAAAKKELISRGFNVDREQHHVVGPIYKITW
jgi:hypothetical protein